MKKMVGNNKGFTLIELVIVIAILGVLAAVAITMFPKLSDTSRAGADKTRASQIKSAIATYMAESGDKDGSGLDPANPSPDGSGITTLSTDDVLIELQTGTNTGFGPYLEKVSATAVADDYLPQQDGMTTWTITVDANGNVKVDPA